MIACIAPPGTVFGHTATVEKTPWARTNADALTLCALFNSFPFDWLVRQKAATHLSLYLLRALPVPSFSEAESRFLAHGALLLSCNHAGYDDLWKDQTGGIRQRAGWAVRAEIDAVVAHGYGLNRSQYDHLLRSFSHRSQPEAPELCLAAFDRSRPPPMLHDRTMKSRQASQAEEAACAPSPRSASGHRASRRPPSVPTER